MWTQFDKAITAGVGMALLVLNALAGQTILTPTWQGYVSLGIAVLTPISVYLIKNKPA